MIPPVPADWFGAKRTVKNALSYRPINYCMRQVLRLLEPTPTIARLPVALAEVECRVRDVAFVMMNPSSCSIAKELFWGRGHRVRSDERTSLELFVDLAQRSNLILDIGANTGLFALAAARASPTPSVHAFEIVPEVFELLVRNIVRNDLADRISCHLEGVAEHGTVRVRPIGKLPSLPTSASLVDQPVRGTVIPTRSLDEVLATTPPLSRVLLKVDIEGAEDILFEHASTALESHHPDIICEIIPGTDSRGVVERTLRNYAYRRYRIEDGYVRFMSTLEPSSRFHDWLFTPSAWEDLARLTPIPIISE
jgi:FkbM family methyltransferase